MKYSILQSKFLFYDIWRANSWLKSVRVNKHKSRNEKKSGTLCSFFKINLLDRSEGKSSIHWFSLIIPVIAEAGAGQGQEPRTQSSPPHVWQEFIYLSHHLPPTRTYTIRKLDWEVEPGFEYRHCVMGCGYIHGI